MSQYTEKICVSTNMRTKWRSLAAKDSMNESFMSRLTRSAVWTSVMVWRCNFEHSPLRYASAVYSRAK